MFTATARQSAAVMDLRTVDSTLRLVAHGSGCAAAFFSRARQSPTLLFVGVASKSDGDMLSSVGTGLIGWKYLAETCTYGDHGLVYVAERCLEMTSVLGCSS